MTWGETLNERRLILLRRQIFVGSPFETAADNKTGPPLSAKLTTLADADGKAGHLIAYEKRFHGSGIKP